MNPTLYKAALIDLDGTLVDSIPDLAMAANAMREELGMDELPLDLLSHFVGKGMDNLIKRSLAGQLDAPEPLLLPVVPDEREDVLGVHYKYY